MKKLFLVVIAMFMVLTLMPAMVNAEDPPPTPSQPLMPNPVPPVAGTTSEPSFIPDYNDPPLPVSVFNERANFRATIWLSGVGLSSSDLLITESNPSGAAYQAMLQLADGSEVLATYNIHLLSGNKSTGSEMHLVFKVGKEYAGQDFTLVHQKADGTYEYFYATADVNGILRFGPLFELSPFLLAKGTLSKGAVAQIPDVNIVDVPKTGDEAQSALWVGFMLIGLLGLSVAAYATKRKRA